MQTANSPFDWNQHKKPLAPPKPAPVAEEDSPTMIAARKFSWDHSLNVVLGIKSQVQDEPTICQQARDKRAGFIAPPKQVRKRDREAVAAKKVYVKARMKSDLTNPVCASLMGNDAAIKAWVKQYLEGDASTADHVRTANCEPINLYTVSEVSGISYLILQRALIGFTHPKLKRMIRANSRTVG